MDKRARRLDRIQNILIAALTASSLLLLTRTPLFGSFSDRPLRQWYAELLHKSTASSDSSQTALSAFSTPIRLLCTNDFARFGQDAVTVLDSGFESVSVFLESAVETARAPSSVSAETFLSELQGPGIYVDFTVELPLNLHMNSLQISPELPDDTPVRRILLTPGSDDTAVLYLSGTDGTCLRCATEVKSAEVRELLNEQSGNGAFLCAQLSGEYSALSPYTLVLAEQTPRTVLSASNPLSDADYTELLRAAEFNPHTENRYTEATGTTVIREGSSSLHIAADGTVSYQGGSAEEESLYRVDCQAAAPTAVEAVSAVQKLAASLFKNGSGAAALYLSGVSATAAGYTVTLDYVAEGTPIRFSDGSHALSATITGQSITAFSLRFRSYALTDEAALLLPLRQALAIAEEQYAGSEPVLCYVDTGADSVLPGWIAG